MAIFGLRAAFAALALTACAHSSAPPATGPAADAKSSDTGADSASSATGDSAGDEQATEVAIARKVVTATTKQTKTTPSGSFTLTITGPFELHVGEDGHYELQIDTTGPVKGLAPKVTFAHAQLGTKSLQTPMLADGAAALTYKLSGIVPATAGPWHLRVDVKDQDGADFDVTALP